MSAGVMVAAGSAAAVAAAAGAYTVVRKKRAVSPHKRLEDLIANLPDDDKIHLFCFPAFPLAPSLSPFCVKVETYLRVAGIPYEAHVLKDPSISPNECLPFIVHGSNCIADSENIIDYLKTKVDIDASLTPIQEGDARAIRATFEHSLMPAIQRMAICEDMGRTFLPFVAGSVGLPRMLIPVVGRLARHFMRKKYILSGYATLNREQYEDIFLSDIDAIEAYLGDNDFFLGTPRPTTVDCVAFMVLLLVVRGRQLTAQRPPSQSETRFTAANDDDDNNIKGTVPSPDEVYITAPLQLLADSPPLVAYVERMIKIAFPDIEERTMVQRDIDAVLKETDRIKRDVEERGDQHPPLAMAQGRSIKDGHGAIERPATRAAPAARAAAPAATGVKSTAPSTRSSPPSAHQRSAKTTTGKAERKTPERKSATVPKSTEKSATDGS